jgi:hypothetical protein
MVIPRSRDDIQDAFHPAVFGVQGALALVCRQAMDALKWLERLVARRQVISSSLI